jgi:hypothetical protein
MAADKVPAFGFCGRLRDLMAAARRRAFLAACEAQRHSLTRMGRAA